MALHPLSAELTAITLVVPEQWICDTELGSRGSGAGMQTPILCTMIALLNLFIVQVSAGRGKRGSEIPPRVYSQWVKQPTRGGNKELGP